MKTPGFLTDTLLSEDIDDHFGFVYCITNTLTGKDTSSRKYFHQLRKPRGGGRRVKVKATGKNTTEVLLNLLKTARSSEIWSSNETF